MKTSQSYRSNIDVAATRAAHSDRSSRRGFLEDAVFRNVAHARDLVGIPAFGYNTMRPRFIPWFSQVDDRTIDELLDLQYGKPRTFIALSLLYDGLDWSGSNWHVDHIIPQVHAQKSVLRGRNLPEYRIQELLDSVNRVGNLQLLRGEENIEKRDIPFRSWITGRNVDFYDQHMIPERLDLCDVMQLPEFVRAREKLIRKRLTQILGLGSH